MSFDEFRGHDALGLAALVRQGEVTSGEPFDAAIQHADGFNPGIEAIVRRPTDELAGSPGRPRSRRARSPECRSSPRTSVRIIREQPPVAESLIDANLSLVSYTQADNLTGRPALSLPLHGSPEAVPVGCGSPPDSWTSRCSSTRSPASSNRRLRGLIPSRRLEGGTHARNVTVSNRSRPLWLADDS